MIRRNNRGGNDGQTISDKNIKIRNSKVCKELTAKYGLYYPRGKEQVRRERLREPDKTKYAIYDAIRGCLPGCKSWGDLEKRLQERGITTTFKYCGNTDRRQGVLFGMSGYTFSGSKIDRAFSFSKLDRHFSQAQRIVTPIVQPRYSAQAIGNLSVAELAITVRRSPGCSAVAVIRANPSIWAASAWRTV